MIRPSVTVDDRAFRQAMREYIATSKRDIADIANNVAFDISVAAIKETPRADKAKIQAVEKADWWPRYVAHRIKQGVGATFTREGQSRKVKFQGKFTRAQARAVSKKIIASRIRARGYIASGFIFAAKDLARKVFGTATRVPRRGNNAPEGRPTGRGVAAKVGQTAVAEIVNTALTSRFFKRRNALSIAQAAMRRAIAFKTADLRRVVEKRLAKTAQKFSAK